MSDQYELTSIFCARPQQFAWLLGAGASATAGLPTAWDVIWDLKRRYYCRQENQKITRQDLQIQAVKARIQSYMLSKGFPEEGDPTEYTTYFQKIFADDRERQRQYLNGILSEEKVTLSVGNRVLGALLATGRTRAVFTTNFDSVVERAVAEVSGRSLSAYHLEGTASANKALSAEDYPFYCKLHGDFRYDSIKNLRDDLATQDKDLTRSFLTAGNRFGLIVTGYSGRDESIMSMLRSVLDTSNPYPHGLFWTGMKNAAVLPAVTKLIEDAKRSGVNAAVVEVETFDAFMLRLWRNLEGVEPVIDAKVRKMLRTSVNIPIPEAGSGSIVRMNALPILSVPGECHAVTFQNEKEWSDLRAATRKVDGKLIFTKLDTVLCWGRQLLIREQFKDIITISNYDLTSKISDIDRNLNIKPFIEEAICHGLARGKPLLSRTNRSGSFLIIDAHSDSQADLIPLHPVVGKAFGQISGLFAPTDDEHPNPEKVFWAEALRISINITNGKIWLLLDPDIWIWPPRARKHAADFLDKRQSNRYNNVYNKLLDAWIEILIGSARNAEISISTYEGAPSSENPSFIIGSRTAFTRRITS